MKSGRAGAEGGAVRVRQTIGNNEAAARRGFELSGWTSPMSPRVRRGTGPTLRPVSRHDAGSSARTRWVSRK